MIFSKEDVALINTIDTRFPGRNIKDKFNYFASLKPEERLQKADETLRKTQRSGWLHIGVPQPLIQNVWQHQQAMQYILEFMGEDKRAIKMAYVHDMAESIVSDFNPLDPINKKEKEQIESVAAKVIFEAFPEEHCIWLDYEGRTSPHARITKDADLLEMVAYTTHIEKNVDAKKIDLNQFWDNAASRFMTNRGFVMYEELKDNRKSVAQNGTPSSKMYAYVASKGLW